MRPVNMCVILVCGVFFLLVVTIINDIPAETNRSALHFDESNAFGSSLEVQAPSDGKLSSRQLVSSRVAGSPTTVKKILILSTWRAGLSFLGELIHSSPNVFYSYEPLHSGLEAMDLVDSLFKCEFPLPYLQHINGLTEVGRNFVKFNRHLWNACRGDRPLCANPDFVSPFCKRFPVHLIKEPRIRLGFFRHPQENWKVVYLARDPRGIMASRASLEDCKADLVCNDPTHMCGTVEKDVRLMIDLQAQFPDNYYLLKMEDLSTDTAAQTQKLFRFLELPIEQPVQDYIRTHTISRKRKELRNPYSTYRMSKRLADSWRSKLPAEQAANISAICSSVMDMLHYS